MPNNRSTETNCAQNPLSRLTNGRENDWVVMEGCERALDGKRCSKITSPVATSNASSHESHRSQPFVIFQHCIFFFVRVPTPVRLTNCMLWAIDCSSKTQLSSTQASLFSGYFRVTVQYDASA